MAKVDKSQLSASDSAPVTPRGDVQLICPDETNQPNSAKLDHTEYTIDIELSGLDLKEVPVQSDRSQASSSHPSCSIQAPLNSCPTVMTSPLNGGSVVLAGNACQTKPPKPAVDLMKNIVTLARAQLTDLKKDGSREKSTTNTVTQDEEEEDVGKANHTDNVPPALRTDGPEPGVNEQEDCEDPRDGQNYEIEVVLQDQSRKPDQENGESDDSEVTDLDEEEDEVNSDDDSQYYAPDPAGEHHCSVCEQKFINAFLLREHMHVHTGVRPYRCAECSKQFCQLANYRAHLRSHAKPVVFRCKVCQSPFLTQDRLRLHLDTTHFEKQFYQCDLCKKVFTSLDLCQAHVLKHKAEIEMPRCAHCKRRFVEEMSLQRHIQRRICRRTFHCSDCGESFRKKNTLLRHSFTHLGLLPYTCLTCKTHFRLANLYRKHTCKPESIRCVACLSVFPNHKDFEEHKKATGCWGYQGAQATPVQQQKLMQQHQQHSTSDIRCMECGQTFATAMELKKHAGSHQRVLKCAECGMGFRSSIMLMSHMGGHAGQRPCLCQSCGLGFPHQQGYDLHLKDCGKPFNPKPPLRKKPIKSKSKRTTPPAVKTSLPHQRKRPQQAIKLPEVEKELPSKETCQPGSTGTTDQQLPGDRGTWTLTINNPTLPELPYLVLCPLPLAVPQDPPSLTASIPQTPNTAELRMVSSQSRKFTKSNTPLAPKPPLNPPLVPSNPVVARVSPLKQQQEPCLPTQMSLGASSAIKKEPVDDSYSDACASMKQCDTSHDALTLIKKEEQGKGGVELLTTSINPEIKAEFVNLESLDLGTEMAADDLTLSTIMKEFDEIDRSISYGEQSSLMSDVKVEFSKQLEQLDFVIADVQKDDATAVSSCLDVIEKDQTSPLQAGIRPLKAQAPELPLDLRLNLDNVDACQQAIDQKKATSRVMEESLPQTQPGEVEGNYRVTQKPCIPLVDIDLSKVFKNGVEESEPHECMTCGHLIADGDMVQHYMEHAAQGNQRPTPCSPKSRTPSEAGSSSVYLPSGGSSPGSSPPASPPSKRLRSSFK